jgi:hypothetical protein
MESRNINKVEFDLDWWKEKEKKIDTVFSPGVRNGKSYKRAKYRYYRNVYRHYRQNRRALSPDERFTLKMLRDELKLQRPGLHKYWAMRRVFRLSEIVSGTTNRLFGTYDNTQSQYAQIQLARHSNRQDLSEGLRRNGFEQAIPEMERKMQQGLPEFNVPISYYLDKDRSIEYNLHFKKADDNGTYIFDKYEAHLLFENAPERNRSQPFRVIDNHTFRADEAQHLLEGRAIEKQFVDAGNNAIKSWVQLNFNEREVDGGFKLKRFPPEHGFNLEKAVSELPILENSDITARNNLYDTFRNGKIATVTVHNGHQEIKLFAVADPREGEIKLFNQLMEPLSREQLKQMTQSGLTIVTPSVNPAQQENHKYSEILSHKKPQIIKKPTVKKKGPHIN